uniref:Uncharacterized protein n=1 Tax=Macrostomum lignano TaxID=282301 RepID=A0A1I8FNL9_9PLAT
SSQRGTSWSLLRPSVNSSKQQQEWPGRQQAESSSRRLTDLHLRQLDESVEPQQRPPPPPTGPSSNAEALAAAAAATAQPRVPPSSSFSQSLVLIPDCSKRFINELAMKSADGPTIGRRIVESSGGADPHPVFKVRRAAEAQRFGCSEASAAAAGAGGSKIRSTAASSQQQQQQQQQQHEQQQQSLASSAAAAAAAAPKPHQLYWPPADPRKLYKLEAAPALWRPPSPRPRLPLPPSLPPRDRISAIGGGSSASTAVGSAAAAAAVSAAWSGRQPRNPAQPTDPFAGFVGGFTHVSASITLESRALFFLSLVGHSDQDPVQCRSPQFIQACRSGCFLRGCEVRGVY